MATKASTASLDKLIRAKFADIRKELKIIHSKVDLLIEELAQAGTIIIDESKAAIDGKLQAIGDEVVKIEKLSSEITGEPPQSIE